MSYDKLREVRKKHAVLFEHTLNGGVRIYIYIFIYPYTYICSMSQNLPREVKIYFAMCEGKFFKRSHGQIFLFDSEKRPTFLKYSRNFAILIATSVGRFFKMIGT